MNGCRWLVGLLFPVLVWAGPSGSELEGFWQARKVFGPELHGPLVIRTGTNGMWAEIGGHRVAVVESGDQIRFELPDGARFEGRRIDPARISGHWLQPRSPLDGNRFATPVHLTGGAGAWEGNVVPQPDTGTFYLRLKAVDDRLTADWINPERNLGVFEILSHLQFEGSAFSVIGSRRWNNREGTITAGQYDAERDRLSIAYPWRGGPYEFQRMEPRQAHGFLPRKDLNLPLLDQPPALNDGWQTASIAEAGLDGNRLRQLIAQHVLPQPADTRALRIHSLLIARHGRLVVEEYFHGFHRDLPHDSRSASKSVTTLVAAAARQDGIQLDWATPVYPLMDKSGRWSKDPRRGEITLEHLLHMASGLDCDDRNPDSKANEDVLWDNEASLDFYEHTLGVDIVHAPGEVAAYCSAGSNLAGGVIAEVAGESLLQLIDRLLAQPLDIDRYSVPVPHDGHPYMGGGSRWRARDFLKFPQLVLDQGLWNGKRVISAEDARRMITPAVKIDGDRDYGYLWWTEDYEIEGRTVRAHFMAGNGGQIAMLVPDLSLSIVFNAGNYSDRVFFRIQQELIPQFILPAVVN